MFLHSRSSYRNVNMDSSEGPLLNYACVTATLLSCCSLLAYGVHIDSVADAAAGPIFLYGLCL